jgi:hypothetical protein
LQKRFGRNPSQTKPPKLQSLLEYYSSCFLLIQTLGTLCSTFWLSSTAICYFFNRFGHGVLWITVASSSPSSFSKFAHWFFVDYK